MEISGSFKSLGEISRKLISDPLRCWQWQFQTRGIEKISWTEKCDSHIYIIRYALAVAVQYCVLNLIPCTHCRLSYTPCKFYLEMPFSYRIYLKMEMFDMISTYNDVRIIPSTAESIPAFYALYCILHTMTLYFPFQTINCLLEWSFWFCVDFHVCSWT